MMLDCFQTIFVAGLLSAVVLHVPLLYAIVVGATGFVVHYLANIVHKPRVSVRDGPFRRFIDSGLPLLKQRYRPTPWLVQKHLHTVGAGAIGFGLFPKLKYRREIFSFLDGGEIALDWLDAVDRLDRVVEHPSMVVIAEPGLGNTSSVYYFRDTLEAARKMGAACVVVNQRGTAGVTLKTSRTYSGAVYEDLAEVVEHVHALHPRATLVALGFSAGGLYITHYAAEMAERAADRLTAAFIVGMPWDTGVASRTCMEFGGTRFLSSMVATQLKREMLNNRDAYHMMGDSKLDVDLALRSVTEYDVEEYFTVPHWGYRDVDEYFEKSSVYDKVSRVKIPILVLNADDDPLVPVHSVPVEQARKSSHVAVVQTEIGGHLGFLEGLTGKEKFSTKLWIEFLTAVKDNPEKLKWN